VRIPLAAAACLLLAGCDSGPPVPGGLPVLVRERVHYGTSKNPGPPAQTHYFEINATNEAYAADLKRYFRWRCAETYIAPQCYVYIWPAGLAPRYNRAPTPDELKTLDYVYFLDRESGQERFVRIGNANRRHAEDLGPP
jgi:hypothetical protein